MFQPFSSNLGIAIIGNSKNIHVMLRHDQLCLTPPQHSSFTYGYSLVMAFFATFAHTWMLHPSLFGLGLLGTCAHTWLLQQHYFILHHHFKGLTK